VEETGSGLSRICQAGMDLYVLSHGSTRDNPAVGIMSIIPRAG